MRKRVREEEGTLKLRVPGEHMNCGDSSGDPDASSIKQIMLTPEIKKRGWE